MPPYFVLPDSFSLHSDLIPHVLKPPLRKHEKKTNQQKQNKESKESQNMRKNKTRST